MKKKAILGFMTGAAIVAATTGSYAAWDSLSGSAKATLKIGQPITVKVENLTIEGVDDVNAGLFDGTTPSYNATVEFTPTIPDTRKADNLQVKLDTKIAGLIEDTDYTVTYKSGEDSMADGVDKSVISGASKTYDVTIQLNDTDSAKTATSPEVTVTATLETVPTGN